MNYRLLVVLISVMCLVVLASAAPVANFSENRTKLFVGQAVQFNDTSTGAPTSWLWEVLDVGFFSTDQNPVYTFNTSGLYSIRLQATNGSASYYTKTDYITVYPTTWNYTTPGTYTWQCPTDVNATSISLDIGAGGGSGRGTYNYGIFHYSGYGGTSGEWQQYSSISVVEGTNYTIVVGAGGASDPPAASTSVGNSEIGNPGGDSSAFGKTKLGGAGAIGGKTVGNGGNASGTGFLTTTLLAQNGTNGTDGYLGGTAVTGYSGGGGGAATDTTNAAYGGKGADGIVRISISGYSGGNVPNFVGSPLTGPAGTLVTFTDTSIIADPTDIIYNWSFGDGSYSSTAGDVVHVYPYTGSYTVTLTITSDVGTIEETKEAYINLVTQQNYVLPTQPKSVRFKVVDAYGNDLPGATVTANYVNSSLPNTDTSWLTSAFGVSTTVATEMTNSGIAMQGITGNDGSLSFIMYPVLQYGITITNATAGLSKYVLIYPQDTDYIIYCPLTSQIEPTSRMSYLYNASLYVTEPNASWITWNLTYSDTSGYTTALTWNVTNWNNMTVMYTNTWGAVGPGTTITDSYTFPSVPAGEEYRAVYRATRVIP